MGFFSTLFKFVSGPSDNDHGQETKVREKREDTSVARGDKLTYTQPDKEKHIHQSYSVDKATGQYKEYGG